LPRSRFDATLDGNSYRDRGPISMHDVKPGPLHGIRVVDLTQFILGPYATQTLGDLGADVIKVEEPSGDRQRRQGKAPKSDTMGPVFVALNRNKRSLALDLKSEAGRRALTRLVKTAHVFIHNMRPEAIKRLGFSYDDVAAIKPDIVYVEAVGYASNGPYAGLQSFDDLVQAASGTGSLIPMVEGARDLRLIPGYVADKTVGLFAAIATLAALNHQARTGEGQFVEVPMLETFTGFMLAEHLWGHTYDPPTAKIGSTTALTPHRKPYKTKDGFIAVLPATRDQSTKFLDLGGIADAYNSTRFTGAPDGKARVEVYYEMMREAALTRTTGEWMRICAENSIPAMRANELSTVFDDPHLKATGFFELREIAGEGRYRAMRPGLRFSKTPSDIRLDPPRIGEHSDEIMRDLGD
jgi:crotonobetainyl-CoA:carnitine CoA-transferase CaiB-like acyl-CoA transferase